MRAIALSFWAAGLSRSSSFSFADPRHACRHDRDHCHQLAGPQSRPRKVDRWFRRLQLLSAALYSLGTAQTMRKKEWASSPPLCWSAAS
jgi:hypothetical protein